MIWMIGKMGGFGLVWGGFLRGDYLLFPFLDKNALFSVFPKLRWVNAGVLFDEFLSKKVLFYGFHKLYWEFWLAFFINSH
ncbi:hypothetical protein [uncultured Gammaproteobacteria bacterium]|nr:hypothetical protein [uncultured Gammaproteobacteria bacterium]CAC9512796.1 hypothetical protein [uncultured Gammaproteobacteria bacterium]